MARYAIHQHAGGLTLGLDYNANNGKVTALYCANQLTVSVYGEARLGDGRAFGQTVGPTTDTLIAFPANLVTLTFDAEGEPLIGGVVYTLLRVP